MQPRGSLPSLNKNGFLRLWNCSGSCSWWAWFVRPRPRPLEQNSACRIEGARHIFEVWNLSATLFRRAGLWGVPLFVAGPAWAESHPQCWNTLHTGRLASNIAQQGRCWWNLDQWSKEGARRFRAKVAFTCTWIYRDCAPTTLLCLEHPAVSHNSSLNSFESNAK